LKILWEKRRKLLEGIGFGYERAPIAQEIRARINKWDCVKLAQSFFPAMETIFNPQNGIKLRTQREITILSTKRISKPINKWVN
jgi:hypothetical protein